MAFLDNSGDIILDAVLTDLGRQRMARGDFNIRKFAFGDEEINYESFNPLHPSGSSFADIEIMQTPVLEAFTNNMSLMKTKLVTMSRNNILYLPIFKINAFGFNAEARLDGGSHPQIQDGFVLIADQISRTYSTGDTPGGVALAADRVGANIAGDDFFEGVLLGDPSALGPSRNMLTKNIVIDQGIESDGFPGVNVAMPEDLRESSFLFRMDHRLLRLTSGHFRAQIRVPDNRFVDDDAIASYYVNSSEFVTHTPAVQVDDNDRANQLFRTQYQFNGPLGARLRFALRSSLHVQSSDTLYDELGSTWLTAEINGGDGFYNGDNQSYKYIDTIVQVVGVTTGYSLDIPIRIVRKIT